MLSNVSIIHESSEEPILTFLDFKDKDDGTIDTDIQIEDDFLMEACHDLTAEEMSELVQELIIKATNKEDGLRLLIEKA